MRYTIKELMEKLDIKNINLVRSLLSLPPYEQHRAKLNYKQGGRCFVYDLDDELLKQFHELFMSRSRRKNEKL